LAVDGSGDGLGCVGTVDLRHLRYFVAVAEELNFSRAAQRLRMAQPPLSVAIRQLEQEIGASLFARTSREVKLTEAGEALLEGARRTLAEASAAVSAAQRVAAGEVGVLRIGYNWSAGFDTLPIVGQAFKRAQPEVELVAEEMRPNRMTASLRSGAIDAAIALYPEIVGDFSYRPVRHEPVVAVLSTSHRLAQTDAIRLNELCNESLLFPRELAPRLHDFYAELCRSAGFEPRESDESARSRWLLGTWDAETAALFPKSVSSDLPRGAVAVPIITPADAVETQIVWRSDNRSAALAAFVEVASSAFLAAGQPS
jgi:DNA-binding transcriptional LysR family regulator